MVDYDKSRDCEHGRQIGKCGDCEYQDLLGELSDVRDELAVITAQRDELIDELDTTKKALAMAVNAGPDSLLELAKKDISYYMTEAVKTVTAQRDELLKALKGITYKDGEDYFTAIQDGVPLREVKHAISKCEVQNDG